MGIGLALFKGKAIGVVKHLILRTWTLPSGMRDKNGSVGSGDSELLCGQYPWLCKDRTY